jgi:hypothetical protein
MTATWIISETEIRDTTREMNENYLPEKTIRIALASCNRVSE